MSLNLAVCIPAYNEPNITDCLNSLAKCQKPSNNLLIVLVVNSGENESDNILSQNNETILEAKNWIPNKPDWIDIETINLTSVDRKIAGVGNARKVAMDAASKKFTDKKNTVLICFDADCTCSENYLTEIERTFSKPKIDAASIYFEHEINATLHEIIDYELFLRYHIQSLKHINYPYAIHTIGSSMAIRANTYHAFGGMNQRKAGEDFYFLHKIIPYRNVAEITKCTVYASNRSSDRVPFGTGHAVEKHKQSVCKTYYTYHPNLYLYAGRLVELFRDMNSSKIDTLPKPLKSFLDNEQFDSVLSNFKKQCKTPEQLKQFLMRWLNGFRMLKLIHYLRDTEQINVPINEAVTLFWQHKFHQKLNLSNYEWLLKFRKLEK
ncbi:MAG: glycosyltransferase [Flavobacteriales bacterium]|nr:glycosyltransferase [Flavobacteriales bacterium]